MTTMTHNMLLNIISENDYVINYNEHNNKRFKMKRQHYVVKNIYRQPNNLKSANYSRRYRNNHQQRPKIR